MDDHLDTLLSITLVRSSPHVAALRKLYNQVQACANSLNGLGVPPAQYAALLYQILMRSLLDDLPMLYRQKIRESENQTAVTLPDETCSTEERAENVNALLYFLRIQAEIKKEWLGTVYSQPQGHPSYDSGVQYLCQDPVNRQINFPTVLAMPAASTPYMLPYCFTMQQIMP